MPSEKKMSHKGQIPLIARLHSARRQLFPPWPPSRPGSAQEIVLPSFKKEKQAQKNKPVKHEKNKSVFVFFVLPSDGKLTIKFTCPKRIFPKESILLASQRSASRAKNLSLWPKSSHLNLKKHWLHNVLEHPGKLLKIPYKTCRL